MPAKVSRNRVVTRALAGARVADEQAHLDYFEAVRPAQPPVR